MQISIEEFSELQGVVDFLPPHRAIQNNKDTTQRKQTKTDHHHPFAAYFFVCWVFHLCSTARRFLHSSPSPLIMIIAERTHRRIVIEQAKLAYLINIPLYPAQPSRDRRQQPITVCKLHYVLFSIIAV